MLTKEVKLWSERWIKCLTDRSGLFFKQLWNTLFVLEGNLKLGVDKGVDFVNDWSVGTGIGSNDWSVGTGIGSFNSAALLIRQSFKTFF